MTTALLAIDVGGSTSRASLIDSTGRCLGQGRNRGGNPASNNPEQAASAIIAAVEAAVAEAGGASLDISIALIALAGPRVHVAEARLEQAFRALGLSGPVVFSGDLHALLGSVTAATDGYCIVAGTGAGAVRFRDGEVEAVVDAVGWLLGDLGSGYWLGHQAAIAVTADLEERGEPTALTGAILSSLDIAWSGERSLGTRPVAQQQLIDKVYAMRPIELARFAPLVIANRGDAVAARLLAEAEGYLLADFRMVFDPRVAGPVALGGGIIGHLRNLPEAVAGVLREAGHTPDIRLATDGSVGACVLALRASGISVDEAMVRRIAESIGTRKAAPAELVTSP